MRKIAASNISRHTNFGHWHAWHCAVFKSARSIPQYKQCCLLIRTLSLHNHTDQKKTNSSYQWVSLGLIQNYFQRNQKCHVVRFWDARKFWLMAAPPQNAQDCIVFLRTCNRNFPVVGFVISKISKCRRTSLILSDSLLYVQYHDTCRVGGRSCEYRSFWLNVHWLRSHKISFTGMKLRVDINSKSCLIRVRWFSLKFNLKTNAWGVSRYIQLLQTYYVAMHDFGVFISSTGRRMRKWSWKMWHEFCRKFISRYGYQCW